MRFRFRCGLVLLGLGCAATVFAAPSDLVTVTTHVTFPTANQGGADEGTCLVSNDSTTDVRVRLDVHVVYSDGSVQRLTGISDPGVLGPGDAYQLSVFFVVPADAPLGTGQFVCEAVAQARNLREVETSAATFEVVP